MNKSIWNESSNEYNNLYNIERHPKLTENIDTDVLIVGGGIVGIIISYRLRELNVKNVVIEKNKIGNGITSKTTAFITAQHEILYQDLVKNKGFNKAKEYLELNNQSINEYFKIGTQYDIDLKVVDSTLFSKNENIIKKEYDVLRKLDQDVYINDNIPYYEGVKGISFKNQLILNPIKLIKVLSKELDIYEDSEIIEIKRNVAILKNNAKVKFKKVIIATHYPITNKLNRLFMKLTQRRSYVVAVKSKNIKDVVGTFCSIDNTGLYFRMYQDYLIIGGNDRDTGELCLNDFEKDVINKFNISKEDIKYRWVGQDCITCDGIPYIGYRSIFYRNHYIVTGFNLWGFTWAMASSRIISQMILNNKELKLTKVNRFILNKNLFENIKKAIKNLLKFNRPRCTHIGCALIYNKNERIWECPCHGSIFKDDLRVIKGPAQKDVKNKW